MTAVRGGTVTAFPYRLWPTFRLGAGWTQPLRDEIFHDGVTTFWMVADDRRAANDAVAEVANREGPFENYINVQLVTGRIERGGDASAVELRFVVDPAGDTECWEVDAQ